MRIRKMLIKIWLFVDPFYCSFTRLRLITSSLESDGVFRVRLTKYKGNDVILTDGTEVFKNDLFLKIHLHNVKVLNDSLNVKNEMLKGRQLYRKVKNSMPSLASFIRTHPDSERIKGVIGITMINKGYLSLGFDCVFPQNKMYSLYKKISHIPIYLLSKKNFSMEVLKKERIVYLMMSKDKLLDSYKIVSE
ncbi:MULTISPECIES: YkoP family protein [Bacillus]|uniref:YkoP family protein n=1 Tax=Bacillus TaxID=1386 RepID=UPI00031EFC4A|nr:MULTISPECIES: hypothetical protein [Bacillus]